MCCALIIFRHFNSKINSNKSENMHIHAKQSWHDKVEESNGLRLTKHFTGMLCLDWDVRINHIVPVIQIGFEFNLISLRSRNPVYLKEKKKRFLKNNHAVLHWILDSCLNEPMNPRVILNKERDPAIRHFIHVFSMPERQSG